MTADSDVPNGWAATTLGEAFDTTRRVVNPQTMPTLKFIGLEHVEPHTMRLLGTVPASEMRSNAASFEPGDVLYGRLRPYLNKVLCTDFRGLCSGEFIIFRHSSHVEGKYLQYFLNSWSFVSFASHLNEGDRPRVSLDQLADYPFLLPPVPEQRRIVAEIEKHLSRLDVGVAALKRAQAKLRRYRASVLKAACEGRLVPQDPNDEPASELLKRALVERRAGGEEDGQTPMRTEFYREKGRNRKDAEPALSSATELPELPAGWCWATVGQLCALHEQAVLTGPFGSNLGREDFVDSGVPVLTIGCLTERGLTLVKALYVSEDKAMDLERYRVRRGDLLFSRMATVGRADLVTERLAGSLINYHLMRLRLCEAAVGPAFFISFVRGSRVVTEYIREVNHGATRDGINTAQLMGLPVALPPFAEQERIVAEVERRLSVVDELEAMIEANLKRADRLRQAILKRAFEGKLVQQDPADEPASALLERIKSERQQAAGQKSDATGRPGAPNGRRAARRQRMGNG